MAGIEEARSVIDQAHAFRVTPVEAIAVKNALLRYTAYAVYDNLRSAGFGDIKLSVHTVGELFYFTFYVELKEEDIKLFRLIATALPYIIKPASDSFLKYCDISPVAIMHKVYNTGSKWIGEISVY